MKALHKNAAKTAMALAVLVSVVMPVTSERAHAVSKKVITLNVSLSGNAQEIQIRKEEGAIFERLYPNVKINWINLGANREQKTLTLIAGGDPPDIFYLNNWTKPLAARGVLLPLNSFIQHDKTFKLNRFYQNLLTPLYFKNKLYALPSEVSPMVIYYNEALFQKAGLPLPTDKWTEAQFLNDAKKLTNPSMRKWGFYMSNWYGPWGAFLADNGANMYTKNVTKSGLGSQGALKGLEFMQHLVVNDQASPNPATEQALGIGDDAMFRNQQVAMIYDGLWYLPEFQQQPLPFKWNVVMIPKGINQITESGILNWGISSKTKYPQLAWDLIKVFTDKNAEMLIGKSLMALPAVKDHSVVQAVLNTKFPSHVDEFVKAAPLVTTMDQDSVKDDQVNNLIDDQISLLLSGKQTPKQTQANIVAQTNKILSTK